MIFCLDKRVHFTLACHGADVNAVDNDGRTAMMLAAQNGHLTPELLKVLVSIGADVNARDKKGITAMMSAAQNGHLTPELLDTLVFMGSDLNARDKKGKAAMIFAAQWGNLTLVLAKTFADAYFRLGTPLEEVSKQTERNKSAGLIVKLLKEKLNG